MKNPYRLPSSFLGATKRIEGLELPVSQIEPEHGVSAGIRLRSFGSGLVPLYEEHESRLERGIELEAWGEMEEMEKALIVAARRIRIAIKNLQEEAQIEESERKMRKH